MGSLDPLANGSLASSAVLLVATVLVYSRTFAVPWYLDDIGGIVENLRVHDLHSALREVATARGLGTLSFALDFARSGPSPAAFHLTNLVIHLAASFGALLALRSLFPRRPEAALFGALVFALHPLQTAAVTYVVQRYASLCGMLSIAAVALYLAARERVLLPGSARARILYVGAFCCGTAACFVKQNAVILPLLIALVEVALPGGGRELPAQSLRARLAPVAPFLLGPLWVALSTIGWGAPSTTGATGGEFQAPTAAFEVDVIGSSASSFAYLATQVEVLWRYLRLVVLPVGQVFDLGLEVPEKAWTLRSGTAAVGLIALIGAALALRRRWPRVTLGVLWYFAAHSVESTFIVLDPYFEHRNYLPMFGIAIAAAEGLSHLVPGAGVRRRLAVGLAVAAGLGALTLRRNEQWRDPVQLWGADVAAGSTSYRSAVGLADALYKQGKTAEATAVYRDFLARAELRCQKTTCGARYLLNVGGAAERIGDVDRAMQLYRRAAQLAPTYSLAHYNLGVLLYRAGRREDALTSFQRAMELSPGDGEATYNWAIAALDLGRRDLALQGLRALRGFRPDLAARVETALRERSGTSNEGPAPTP